MKMLFLWVALCTWLSACATDGVPVVTTEEGSVSGIEEKAVNGIPFHSYYGIPFSQPPVGQLRFKDPKDPMSWEGIRDGSSIPPVCLQVRFGIVMTGMKIPPEHLDGQEDCLYLNVFRPQQKDKDDDVPEEGYPVMVYIHGGGFFAGASDEYLPHVLLSRDIILVVIQYRLGFLGFLSTEDSTMPGNYGLKDQTMALRWVQRNIRNFGGNPDKVTIFGESAGGASVHYQMLTPKAKGLFRGAILQSGNALCPWTHMYDLRKVARRVGHLVGCSIEEGSQRYLECMQGVTGGAINAAIQDIPVWFQFPLTAIPRIDGDYIPDHPATLMKEGRYNKVNVISGITADEGAIFTHTMYARPDILPDLETNFSVKAPHSLQWSLHDENPLGLTEQVYNYYLDGINLSRNRANDVTRMMSDNHFKVCHDLMSESHALQKGVSTFRYELEHRGQMSVGDFVQVDVGKDWISHGDEIYYLFRGGPLLQPFEPYPSDNPRDIDTQEDLHLRHIILTLWTNFAATGNPTPDDSLGFLWEDSSPDNLRYLSLSPTPIMAKDSRKEVREFFSSLPTEQNRLLNPDLIKEIAKTRTKNQQEEL